MSARTERVTLTIEGTAQLDPYARSELMSKVIELVLPNPMPTYTGTVEGEQWDISLSKLDTEENRLYFEELAQAIEEATGYSCTVGELTTRRRGLWFGVLTRAIRVIDGDGYWG